MSVNELLAHESDSEENTPVPTQEELNDFKGCVSEWTKLDDQIRKLQIALSERKTHKKALDERIKAFMVKFEYHDLSIPTGMIMYRVRKTKTPISITSIKSYITEHPDLKGEDLFKEIFEKEREIIEKPILRRHIPPVSMSLSI